MTWYSYASGRNHSPEIVISASNHHQAVLSPNLLPEVLHGFRVTLQGILTNDKEDWSLHIQKWIIHILEKVQVLDSASSNSQSTDLDSTRESVSQRATAGASTLVWTRHTCPHSHGQGPSSQLRPILTPLGPSTVRRGNPRQTTAVTHSITDTCQKQHGLSKGQPIFTVSLLRIQEGPRSPNLFYPLSSPVLTQQEDQRDHHLSKAAHTLVNKIPRVSWQMAESV